MISWVPEKSINVHKVASYLESTLTTKQFTNYGPNVQLLESKIRENFLVDNTKAVIVVNNGSTAIQVLAVAIQRVQNNPNFSWATQSFTFPPSAQSTLQNTLVIDIDLDGGIDLKQIPDNIDGIIVTNIFGNVVDIDKYEQWAEIHNKYLIFDNAATMYSFYKGKNCVNYGTGCSVSFHHTKPFGFGEGGAIIIDKKYENSVRCLINFGISLTDEYYTYDGTNGKMSDIAAAYILQYWDAQFDNIIKTHCDLYNYFKQEMINHNITHFKLFPSFHRNNIIVPACISILFDNYDVHYETELIQNGIIARKYYHPLKYTPNSQYIYNSILCIPCTIDMNHGDIDNILDLITTIVIS